MNPVERSIVRTTDSAIRRDTLATHTGGPRRPEVDDAMMRVYYDALGSTDNKKPYDYRNGSGKLRNKVCVYM